MSEELQPSDVGYERLDIGNVGGGGYGVMRGIELLIVLGVSMARGLYMKEEYAAGCWPYTESLRARDWVRGE